MRETAGHLGRESTCRELSNLLILNILPFAHHTLIINTLLLIANIFPLITSTFPLITNILPFITNILPFIISILPFIANTFLISCSIQ